MLITSNGRDIFKDAMFVALDLELTGLNWTNDKLLEHGNVFCDWRGTDIGYYGQIIKPVMSCRDPDNPTGPVHIHNISPVMVENAPTFAEIAHEYATFLNGKIFVGLTNDTDFHMLKKQFFLQN